MTPPPRRVIKKLLNSPEDSLDSFHERLAAHLAERCRNQGCLFDPRGGWLAGCQQAGTPNFGELVLCCMDSYDSNQGVIRRHFSRSTRLTDFRTAYISKFSDFRKILWFILQIFFKKKKIGKSTEIAVFRWKFHGILPEFREIADNCRKSLSFALFSRNSQENLQYFA